MHVIRTKQFEKQYSRLPRFIQQKFYERLDAYLVNPFDPILKRHALRGTYSGLFSINITGDYRLVMEHISKNTLCLSQIGTHAQLYDK